MCRKQAYPLLACDVSARVRKSPTACLLLLFYSFLSWPTSAKPERCVHHPVLIRDGTPDIQAGFATGIVYLRGTDPVATRPNGISRSCLSPAPLHSGKHRGVQHASSTRRFTSLFRSSIPYRIEQSFSHACCSQRSDDVLKWLSCMMYVDLTSTTLF